MLRRQTTKGEEPHAFFETSVGLVQLRLFDLDESLGEEGWLKVSEYAPRQPHYPNEIQPELFVCEETM